MTSNKALLITSAQVDLLSQHGKAWRFTKDSVVNNQVVENLKTIIERARKEGIPVIQSPVAFDYVQLMDCKPVTTIQSVILENKLLELNSEGSKFIEETSPVENDIVLPPRQGFSSFWAESIQAYLKDLEINTLFIAGMLAEGCIESHSRDAAENGFEPIVVSDAIGSTSIELLEASIKTLALHTSKLITTDDFVDKLYE